MKVNNNISVLFSRFRLLFGMNPLDKLHEDVYPLIFQHFSVRDFIKVSQVSKSWEEIIGSSTIAMSKVWLRFYFPYDDVNCLKQSQRNYQNVKIQRSLPIELYPLLDKFKLKSVMMRDHTFDEPEELSQILRKFSQTVEELEIFDISILKDDEPNSLIDFPVLRRFEFNLTTRNTLVLFLGNIPCLEDVKVTGNPTLYPRYKEECAENLETFLKKHSTVKSVTKDFL